MLTLQELTAKIEASNAEFEAASPEQKRCMIAQDCLDRISVKQFVPTNLEFVALPIRSYDKVFEEPGYQTGSVQATLNNSDLKCDVCAKGGLFLSYIGRVNNFDWNNVTNDTEHTSKSIKKLTELFNDEQLIIIEFAFEGEQIVTSGCHGKYVELNNETKFYCRKFYSKYIYPANRLKAICKNIIKNNGTFIP